MDYDLFLKQHDLKYEDLNAVEKETYHNMYQAIQEGALSIEKIKDYIGSMKASIEEELTRYDLGSKQDIFLKARLRNYMLLEGMLAGPEKAKKALEEALGRIVK